MLLNYTKVINDLKQFGTAVESRLGPSREFLATTTMFKAGTIVHRPNFNKALGWMELVQLIGGVYEPEQIIRVAPNAKIEYFSTMSAYGPRIYSAVDEDTFYEFTNEFNEKIFDESYDHDYIQRVLKHLRDDLNSRKAVIFIGKSFDNIESGLSCTLSYQFIARHGVLNAIVSMRSWDAIRGLPYDIIMFGGLLQAAAHILSLKSGFVWVTAGSLHLYDSDLELLPTVNRTCQFKLVFPNDAIWSGIRAVCKNAVYQHWGVNRIPHFIECTPWVEGTKL